MHTMEGCCEQRRAWLRVLELRADTENVNMDKKQFALSLTLKMMMPQRKHVDKYLYSTWRLGSSQNTQSKNTVIKFKERIFN